MKRLICSLCGKKFNSELAVTQHANAYHKKRADEVKALPKPKRYRSNEEMSEGEYLIEQIWNGEIDRDTI